MNKLTLLAGAVALAACTTGVDRRAYLATLVGQPETEIVRQLGVPSRTYETAGHKFLAYDERRADILDSGPFFGGFGYGRYGGFGYSGFAFPPEVIERNCETTLEVVDGVARSWSLRGNACG